MNVKIKLVEGGKMPTKGTTGSAAFDVYCREDVLVSDEAVTIPLGFGLELPKGYCAKILPRSSTGLKTPLRFVGSGLVDEDFRGEVKCVVECKKPYSFYVHKDMRICQMLIEKVEDIEFIEVDELSDTERGASGFGSTGVK